MRSGLCASGRPSCWRTSTISQWRSGRFSESVSGVIRKQSLGEGEGRLAQHAILESAQQVRHGGIEFGGGAEEKHAGFEVAQGEALPDKKQRRVGSQSFQRIAGIGGGGSGPRRCWLVRGGLRRGSSAASRSRTRRRAVASWSPVVSAPALMG